MSKIVSSTNSRSPRQTRLSGLNNPRPRYKEDAEILEWERALEESESLNRYCNITLCDEDMDPNCL